MMVGLLNPPEDVSRIPAFGPLAPVTGPIFDEELLRWIAEAEYLGVSRETAILIATKRRALSLQKSRGDMAAGAQDEGEPSVSERSHSCKDFSRQAAETEVAYPESGGPCPSGEDSATAFVSGPSPESCPGDRVCEGEGGGLAGNGSLSQELLAEKHKPVDMGIRNPSSQTSSTQETITTARLDGLLDQVITSAIAHVNLDEHKRRKKRNKRKKRHSQKSVLSEATQGVIPSQSINAQLLKTIVEKDSSSKQVLSDDNNSSVDTTMGVVNSGTDRVDRLATAHCSGLDALVAAHSNNPFNNNGRGCNIRVRRKKRFCPRNNLNASSSSAAAAATTSRQGLSQSTQAASTLGDFPEPSRINLKHAKKSFNRNRKYMGSNPNSISDKTSTENGHHHHHGCSSLGGIDLRNPGQHQQNSHPPKNSHLGNGRRPNNSEKGRVRPRKSEAVVEHVREQLRIAFRSRGVLEL